MTFKIRNTYIISEYKDSNRRSKEDKIEKQTELAIFWLTEIIKFETISQEYPCEIEWRLFHHAYYNEKVVYT